MIDEKSDFFAFNITTYQDSPYMYLSLSVEQEGGVEVIDYGYHGFETYLEEYSYTTRCVPMISCKMRMTLTVYSYITCPTMAFSWTKVCGSGDQGI